ncbi:polyphosphate kinase 2 [Aestuariibacter halophilus]|uniref:ADP/GDP-polyphosphate phosphotransferase n=1 Tax=Fluctibacter halophilus TaxID=226011 RepID=A0ABS8G5S1_9ALTE|nr:polyphosphate kinase 2 [Aestuariibacter halophilus]MCC2615865.1 polyphosphate kinase 2 [Aestuariibacter halophilus]
MDKTTYKQQLSQLSHRLVEWQSWVAATGQRVVILFEGRDAAGKGSMIRAISRHLNPRIVRVAALGKPSDKQRSQWYFQRYVAELPSAGEVVLFDRSWYNRAGVEQVMGFCTDAEYQEFLRTCPMFEDMLQGSGILLRKYWLSVSDEEQQRRFQARIDNPLKRWKFSNMDNESRRRWVAYSQAKDAMFAHTDVASSPWWVVDADDKRRARLNCIAHLLDSMPIEPHPYPKESLWPIQREGYERPPMHHQNHVPKRY